MSPSAESKGASVFHSAKDLKVAVIGLGYVGLPLALSFARAGYTTFGVDISSARTELLLEGRSPFVHLDASDLPELVRKGILAISSEFGVAGEADAIIICVPTPLAPNKSPDLSLLESACQSVSNILKRGQLVVVESTSWPGTTEDLVRPILQKGGLECGTDFLLAFSPEREDPGNRQFTTTNIPKVVGADDELSGEAAMAVYSKICQTVVKAPSTKIAEAAKLTENAFRAVNIALVNELKVTFEQMGLDVWDVIRVASTKPFGYMPFSPGPGVGGHCIPVDPIYLSSKSKEYFRPTRLIDLAIEINESMPEYVLGRVIDTMDRRLRKGLKGSNILLVGVAYKKNIEDCRESPAIRLTSLMLQRGATVSFHDPHVESFSAPLAGKAIQLSRVPRLNEKNLSEFDISILLTDHDDLDYRLIAETAPLLLDTRNVFSRLGLVRDNLEKA